MSDLKAVAYRNRIVAQLLLEPDEVKIQVPHDASQSRRMTFHNRPIRRLREVPNAVRTKRRNPSMAIMMVARRLPLRPISPHLAPFRMDRRCASFCLESFPKLDAALHDFSSILRGRTTKASASKDHVRRAVSAASRSLGQRVRFPPPCTCVRCWTTVQ